VFLVRCFRDGFPGCEAAGAGAADESANASSSEQNVLMNFP
jgi:hypothetical protein